jgi:NDP-sugar pyrophosphorylase family protein
MRPATDEVPKALLRVAGEPFAVHQLRWLASQGVTDVAYSIGHLGHLIEEELAPRHDLGCTVHFVDEGDDLRGTGGAVRLAVDRDALDDPFFVLYGDSYLDIDLPDVAAAFERSAADALMTVFRNDDRWERSNAVFDGDRVRLYSKRPDARADAEMRWVDYGLSILSRATVRSRVADDRPSDLAVLFEELSVEGRLAGYEARRRFYEIGSPTGLAELEHHLAPQHDDDLQP